MLPAGPRHGDQVKQPKRPRILVTDIETAPLELYGWRIWDESFSLDQIKEDWTILSFSAKWLGEDKIIYMDTGGRGRRWVRHDRKLMKPLWKLLDEADIVVAQNGKKFDMRKINARLIAHGFGPPSPYRVIDTMLVSKKYFAFTSQKLAYTSVYLKLQKQKDEHPEYPGFKLWKAVLQDIPEAWRVMKRYNRQDILATEGVYLKQRPWIENHPNLGAYSDEERPMCPACGSARMNKDKNRRSVKQQGVYIQYRCGDCGHYARGKTMQLSIAKRRSMLAAP
jgi:hypothetical protein